MAKSKSKSDKVVAVACADLHFSDNPPLARFGETDWYAAMLKPLDELREVAWRHHVPILMAGDIFDSWRVSTRLINWLIKHMPPDVYAIPGQHDLPLHANEDIDRSPYHTLELAGMITTATPTGLGFPDFGFNLYGFGWCVNPFGKYPDMGRPNALKIAMVHRYTWVKGAAYPNAPQDAVLPWIKNPYPRFDTVIIGDNHKPWDWHYRRNGRNKETHVFNCGSFMRRHIDERGHTPRIGLVYADGRVVSHFLSTTGDVLTLPRDPAESRVLGDFDDLFNDLAHLNNHPLDYAEILLRAMGRHHLSPDVQNLLRHALEHNGR